MEFLWLKWLHILSATVLFGTGLGTAYFKWTTDRSGDVHAIAVVMRRVVWADWIFTTTTIFIQPITGLWMAHLAGYPLTQGWVGWSLALYALAGACWLPVVWLQLRMRDMAVQAAAENGDLPTTYHRLARLWYWLGIPAFAALLVVYYLMVFRPTV